MKLALTSKTTDRNLIPCRRKQNVPHFLNSLAKYFHDDCGASRESHIIVPEVDGGNVSHKKTVLQGSCTAVI